MKKPLLIWIICGLPVSGLLGYSALVHIDNSYFFLSSIYSYQLFNPTVGVFAAATMPFLQLTLALILLFDRRAERTAFGCSAILFIFYVALQISAMFRDLNISCGCFGSDEENPIGFKSLSFAMGGLILSAFGWFFTRPSRNER